LPSGYLTVRPGEHCTRTGKGLQVLHTKEVPAGAFGRWPEAEVVFACK